MEDNKPKLTPTQFAEKVKKQYPQYQSMNDDDLVSKMIEKYPQYKEQIEFTQKKKDTVSVSTAGSSGSSKNPDFVKDLDKARTMREADAYMEKNKNKPYTPAKPLNRNYGKRNDGSEKDVGYLGELKMKNGDVMTENSIGINIDGKEIEIPTVVPTLSNKEINWLLSGNNVLDNSSIGNRIIDKAVKFANERQAKNLPVFYSSELENKQRTVNFKSKQTITKDNWGQNFVSAVDKAPNVFQEYQQAKSLSADEKNSIKQDLDDEINNKGLMNNITNLAKDWWNGVFSQEPALEIEKNPLAKNLQQVKKEYGNKITPQEATKMAYDMELQKRSASLSESKERAYLKSAQEQGKIPALKKEQIKVYDERSKEYNNAYLKDGALKNGLKEQGDSLVKLQKEISGLDMKSPLYAEKMRQFNSLRQQYNNTFSEYEKNNASLKNLGSQVSDFEHNLDMMKRDYGYWSNFTHNVANAFGDAGKGYVTAVLETPADAIIGALGENTPQAVKDIKQASQETRINYEANREYRSNKHAKPLQIDDIKSPQDFGSWGLNMLASQSYNLLAAGTGGTAGLVGIGVNSGGQKRADMVGEMERGEADYNLTQQVTVPILSGGAEMIGGLVDRFNLRSAGAIVKSATASERSLIAKGMASEFTKNYIKGTAAELSEETGVQIFQNVMDIAVLGKTDVNPLDGVKDAAAGAIFLTGAIQGTGGLTSMGIKALRPFSYDDKITKLNEKIVKLESQLSNPQVDEATKAIVSEQITKLKTNAEAVLKSKIEDVESLSNEQFQEILSLEKQQTELRNKAKEVKNSNLDPNAKEDVLKGLEEEFKTNDNRRVALLQRGAEIQLERIPKEDQVRLKQQAESELKTDAITEVSDNDIAKKALKLYIDEQKNKPKETTTEQEENAATNNEKTIESEYDAEADLEFIQSLETETNKTVSVNEPSEEIQSNENTVPEVETEPAVAEFTEQSPAVETEPTVSEIKLTEKSEPYAVTKENGAVIFRDKKGKEPSAPTKRKLQKEYVKSQDFTQGKLAEESDMESEKNMNQVIANKSENPTQVAEAIININQTDYESDLDYKQAGIADHIGKVERSSFIRFGDKNYINQSIAKQYIAKKGKGQQLDALAQEITEVIGVEVTEQDIIDFMVENSSGVSSFKNRQKSEDLQSLKLKFEQLTGLPATETVLNAIAESNNSKKEYENNLSSLDIYSIEELNDLYNERQERQISDDQLVQDNDQRQNSTSNGGGSGIQSESTKRSRGEKETAKSEPTGIDVATDEELQALVDEKTIYDSILTKLDQWEKELDDFSKGHLSMGIPLVIAKEAIKAMRLATKTSKAANEIVKAGYDYIINTDWYKNLTEKQQSKITMANFKNLVAESIRQITKAESEIQNLSQEISDLRDKLSNNKIEALEVSKMIKDFLKSNKITGKVTPSEINRLVMYANKISTAKDKLQAFDDFVNAFQKIDKKSQDRMIKLSDRQRVEKRIQRELKKGTTEKEIIDLFKEDSSARKIAEDYFERTKTRTDDEIRTKLNRMQLDYYANKFKRGSLSEKLNKAYVKTVQAFFDRAFTVKKAMNQAGMQYATSLYIATKGAPGYANYLYEKAHKEIFSGLTTEQNDNLNLIIRLRRIIALENDGVKKGKDPMVHASNFNLQQAEQALKVLENDLGATEFASLQERANKFYNQQQTLLTQLYENGIITEDFFNEMKDVEYIKTRYLDFLSDADAKSFNVSKGASTDSGIESLSNGWNGTVELNANELLAQSISTTTKALASNRLNLNLIKEYRKNKKKVETLSNKSDLTKAESELVDGFRNIEDKIITAESYSARAPLGFTKVTYFEDGEKKAFFMEDVLYKVYSDNIGSIWGSNVKDKVQTASGVNLVKAIATGQNPTFFITNTPRDLFWIVNTSMAYSNFVPKAIAQLTKDFVKGSFDVKRDSIRYQKAVEYGLMMDFLHLQGKLKFNINPKTVVGRTMNFLGENKGSKAIKYLWEQGMTLGKYSEIGFRMAVFNRTTDNLLKEFNDKNQTNYKSVESIDENLYPASKEKIYTTAVVEARESTVDFNQGGHLSKDLEAIIPYFNAATQGTRMLVEKVAENPVPTILRFTQTAGIVTGMGVGLSLWVLQGLKDDDEDVVDAYNRFYSGVSKFDRANYIVIPTGKDDKGEFEYTRIALPQALTPFFAVSRGFTHDAINKYYNKENAKSFTLGDTDFALKKNLIPIEFGVSENVAKVPVLKAAFSYVTGYDFFREQDISIKRGKVDVIAEGYESKSVEGFYKELGSEFGFSPARAKTATESLITTPSTNIGVGIAYGTMNMFFSKEKSDKSFGDFALKSFGGRVIKSTSDFNRKVSNTEQFKDKNAERDVYNARLEYQANTEVKRFYEGEVKKSEAISSIKEIFGDDKRRIKNYIGRLDKNYSKFSSDAQEIKFAPADKKAALLYAQFGNNLFNTESLTPKQKSLRAELIKMKVLTTSTRQGYNMEVKNNK